MTGFMLDTDISSDIIERRPAVLAETFHKNADALCVSVMTAAELRFGAEKIGSSRIGEAVEAFLGRLAILDWTEAACADYARIRTALERAGTPIGNVDLLEVWV